MLSSTSVEPNWTTGSSEQTGTLGLLKDDSMGGASLGVRCETSTAQTMMRGGVVLAWAGPGCFEWVAASLEEKMD